MNASILTGSAEGVLSRSEMKLIMAGSGSPCGPSCSGCIPDDTSHGECVKWECIDDMWCVPVTSNCCVTVSEIY